MDQHVGSLEKLLEFSARDESEGLGDAPWPPHFRKMAGEAPRVAPSRARSSATSSRGAMKKRVAETPANDVVPDVAERTDVAERAEVGEGTDVPERTTPVRSKAKKPARVRMPLLVIANSPNKEAALAGLERWKRKHRKVAKFLAVDDVLVDSMRGRSSTWTRIRVNLRNVPEDLRPPQETPDPDDDPTREWRSSKSREPKAR
jgi:hypothetical protein